MSYYGSFNNFVPQPGAAIGEVIDPRDGNEYFCVVGEPWTIINVCVRTTTDYTESSTGLDLDNSGMTFPGAAVFALADPVTAAAIIGFGGVNCVGLTCKGSDIIINFLDNPDHQRTFSGIIGWSKAEFDPFIIGSAGRDNIDATERCATGELVHLAIAWDGDIHTDLGPVDSPSIRDLVNTRNSESELIKDHPALVVEIPLRDRWMFPNLRDLRTHQMLRICGRWVTDTNPDEAWNELHPVTSLTIITSPVVDAGSDATINEGSTFSSTGSFTDPGIDIWTATVDYGDGSGVTSLALSDKTFSLNHEYADNGIYTVIVTVNDGNFGEGSDTAIVTVNNVAPSIALSGAKNVNESSPYTLNLGAVTDPGTDTVASYTINWGDGASDTFSGSPPGSKIHTYADGPKGYIIVVNLTDEDGTFLEAGSKAVTVNNVDPTVGSIVAPIDPLSVGISVTASAPFTDPGTADAHTATWDWNDGNTSAGTVTESAGSGTVAGSHIYATPGTYTITLTVTDKDGGTGTTETSQFIVVYDPNGGFVTGAGFIDSPAGAYLQDPTLSGRANFGFISKYQAGATIPTGQTEFKFKAGSLNFNSASYNSLVVAGSRAQYKGIGTINGAGDFGFLLTAVDGQIAGGGGVDQFRIKIWNRASDTLVYDNTPGDESISGSPTEAISGGSILIHK